MISIDFASSGYAVQLFSIFNDINYFCIKENKVSEYIICGKKQTEEIKKVNNLFLSIITTLII